MQQHLINFHHGCIKEYMSGEKKKGFGTINKLLSGNTRIHDYWSKISNNTNGMCLRRGVTEKVDHYLFEFNNQSTDGQVMNDVIK